MLTEFQEIIQKNLPAQVGDALKQRLAIADYADKEIPQLKDQIEKLKITVQDQQKQIATKKEIEQSIELQNKQLETIVEEKRNLEVEKLKIQLEAEKDKCEFSKNIALGLVRNQEFRRSVFDSKYGPDGTDQYGNQRYATHSTNVTETKTAE